MVLARTIAERSATHGLKLANDIRASDKQPSILVISEEALVQGATADAVVDCLIEGIIPKELANELCIISLVWIDPRCAKDPNLDKKDMYRTNYEATKLAITRALNNEPSVDELIANRHKIKHDMDDWS